MTVNTSRQILTFVSFTYYMECKDKSLILWCWYDVLTTIKYYPFYYISFKLYYNNVETLMGCCCCLWWLDLSVPSIVWIICLYMPSTGQVTHQKDMDKKYFEVLYLVNKITCKILHLIKKLPNNPTLRLKIINTDNVKCSISLNSMCDM